MQRRHHQRRWLRTPDTAHARQPALSRSLLPAWNVHGCAGEVLRSRHWHSAGQRGSLRAACEQPAPGMAPPASSPAVSNEAWGEIPDMRELPPQGQHQCFFNASKATLARTHAHKHKKRQEKSFWIDAFYSMFCLEFLPLKKCFQWLPGPVLRGGTFTVPVLAPVLILANCPNAIVHLHRDSWHVDSCLLEIRGVPHKLLSQEELVHMRNHKSCKFFPTSCFQK